MKQVLLSEHTEKISVYIPHVENEYIKRLNEISSGIQELEVGLVTKDLIIDEITGKETAQNIFKERTENEIKKMPSLKSTITESSNKTCLILWNALNSIKHANMGGAYIHHPGYSREKASMTGIDKLNDPKLFKWFDVDENGKCSLNAKAKKEIKDYFSEFITTPEGVKAFELQSKLKETLDELQVLMNKEGNPNIFTYPSHVLGFFFEFKENRETGLVDFIKKQINFDTKF